MSFVTYKLVAIGDGVSVKIEFSKIGEPQRRLTLECRKAGGAIFYPIPRFWAIQCLQPLVGAGQSLPGQYVQRRLYSVRAVRHYFRCRPVLMRTGRNRRWMPAPFRREFGR